jgi:hypothetical protein
MEPDEERKRNNTRESCVLEFSGEVGMTINWLNLLIGAALGTLLGVLGNWQIGARWRKWTERRALNREYHSLAGHYVNYLVKDDGNHEPTGETIELTWQPHAGVFEATSFLKNGHPDWHSYIRMSMEYKGTGTGHYNYVDSIHGGIQQLIYSKQARAFQVMGCSRTKKDFAHYWKLKE